MRAFIGLGSITAVAAIMSATPVAAQVRMPEDGATVVCDLTQFRDTVMAADCGHTWMGFMMPDERINGQSGMVYCTNQGPEMMCVLPAMIYLENRPEPLGRTAKLSCLVKWDMESGTPSFTCK